MNGKLICDCIRNQLEFWRTLCLKKSSLILCEVVAYRNARSNVLVSQTYNTGVT